MTRVILYDKVLAFHESENEDPSTCLLKDVPVQISTEPIFGKLSNCSAELNKRSPSKIDCATRGNIPECNVSSNHTWINILQITKTFNLADAGHDKEFDEPTYNHVFSRSGPSFGTVLHDVPIDTNFQSSFEELHRSRRETNTTLISKQDSIKNGNKFWLILQI